ncbi:NBS-LRR type resistance protein [Cucumis melo var. makuwa]|uniref:NBS-LRR type resistance protein n=1 Tax=Cucumis melo var. makuwa TaxID=1194695 RepID=A0A5D3CBJ7_CUCMM|nr:NBS-LRR type resistance protein [Cucumis melo var. makuwa]TYK07689.1 NBS-LRR type resistance protein [Cucumis melo var. makuwa]
MKITSNKIHQRKHKENQTRPYGLHASFLPLVGLPLTVPLPEKLKRKKERTYQSCDLEGCTYQSSDPEGYTYQSSDPEGCTYQSSDPEGCTYQSSDPEGWTYQSSDPEGWTYQSSDPRGCTYQSSDPEGYRAYKQHPLTYPSKGELAPIKPAVEPENLSVNSLIPSRNERDPRPLEARRRLLGERCDSSSTRRTANGGDARRFWGEGDEGGGVDGRPTAVETIDSLAFVRSCRRGEVVACADDGGGEETLKWTGGDGGAVGM